MELVKEKWSKKDTQEFDKYLYSIRKEDKIEFTKKTVNTSMTTLGIPTPQLRAIAKEIIKGNYISFLDNMTNKYYETTIVCAILINKIDSIEEKEKYLKKLKIDNWATVDILSFKIKGKEKDYINLSKKYIKSDKPFERRIGVRILFGYTDKEDVEEIFKIIDSLYDEEEYYVNMAVAWLMCELVIKNRDKTFEYLKNHNLNDFTINKAVSKCRDSFRVSKEDKDFLTKYRKKGKR